MMGYKWRWFLALHPQLLILIGLSFNIVTKVWSSGVEEEILYDQRLVRDLLDHSNYDKRIRPVRDPMSSINVTIRFNLYQVLNVNEPKQNVELYLWVNQYWKDEFLGWDPEEYGGINKTVLPFESVWLPDTYLYNRRKPLYYLSNLVIPTVIISIIAVVGFFMPASTSGERTEKVNLGITTLLAMSILLLMVSDTMPTTSNFIPLIGWFYLSIIVIISLGTFMTSIVILVHQQGYYGKRVPKCWRTLFFGCLAKLLFMQPGVELTDLMRKKSRKRQRSNDQPNCNRSPEKRNHDTELNHRLVHYPEETYESSQDRTNAMSKKGSVDSQQSQQAMMAATPVDQLDEMRKSLRKIETFVHVKEKHVVSMVEWEYLARILDRFLLIVFFTATVGATLSFLLVGQFAAQLPKTKD